jgi:hypothetical protein
MSALSVVSPDSMNGKIEGLGQGWVSRMKKAGSGLPA